MKRIYLSLSLLLLVIIGSRAANFKFAFLTDIHITAGDSIPYNDLAPVSYTHLTLPTN